jgi:hypothetical protein
MKSEHPDSVVQWVKYHKSALARHTLFVFDQKKTFLLARHGPCRHVFRRRQNLVPANLGACRTGCGCFPLTEQAMSAAADIGCECMGLRDAVFCMVFFSFPFPVPHV